MSDTVILDRDPCGGCAELSCGKRVVGDARVLEESLGESLFRGGSQHEMVAGSVLTPGSLDNVLPFPVRIAAETLSDELCEFGVLIVGHAAEGGPNPGWWTRGSGQDALLSLPEERVS